MALRPLGAGPSLTIFAWFLELILQASSQNPLLQAAC